MHPKMHSAYYLKPGQTLQNTKVSERSLMLVVSKNAFNRFVDYTTESERLAAAAAEEKRRVSALKKATYDMSKSWDNTVENIKKRRVEELLERRKQDEEDRIRFVREAAEKNALDRAAIVAEARKLLLYKKPECRIINGALLTAECFRERDAQIAFQKTLEGIDEENDKEYANLIKKDCKDYEEEENRKAAERMKKNMAYGIELRKQMAGNSNNSKKLERQELEYGKRELKNIERDLQLRKECETEQIIARKRELKQVLADAIEEKQRFEAKLKLDEDFQDRAIEIYAKSKRRIEKMHKLKIREARAEQIRNAELLAKKCAAILKSNESKEEEAINKTVEEREAAELAKVEARKKREADIRTALQEFKREADAAKAKREQEEKDIKKLESLQRQKRNEFDKEFEEKMLMQERQRKMENMKVFRKQIALKEAQRKREREEEVDQMKAIIEKENERILAYGEEVLEESKGVRPLFPIIKAIQQIKKEIGLSPPKQVEETSEKKPARRQRRPRPQCSKPLPEEQLYYL